MNISFNGFGENTVTFEADESLNAAGVPVRITEDGKVAPCAEGDLVCGVAVNVREGFAAVQLKGYVSLPAEGSVGYGWQNITATADGKVQTSDNGTQVLVVASEGDTVGFIL